jgi:hypothetical protein
MTYRARNAQRVAASTLDLGLSGCTSQDGDRDQSVHPTERLAAQGLSFR